MAQTSTQTTGATAQPLPPGMTSNGNGHENPSRTRGKKKAKVRTRRRVAPGAPAAQPATAANPAPIPAASRAGNAKGQPPRMASLLALMPPREAGWTRKAADAWLSLVSAEIDQSYGLKGAPTLRAA